MRKFISAAFLKETAKKYRLLLAFIGFGLLATTGVVFAMAFGDDVHVSGDLFVNGGDFNLGTGTATTTINSSNGDMSFLNGDASSTNRMIIKADGKVGIGTASPEAKLVVSGQSNNIVASFQGRTDLSDNPNIIRYYTTNPNYYWEIWNSDASGGGTTNDLRFKTRPGAGDPVEVLTLDGQGSGQGNVGIGTANPQAKLQLGTVGLTRGIAVGLWSDMSARGGGAGLFGGNMYLNYSDNLFYYSNGHASIGAMGFAVNYPGWNQASVITSGTASSTANTAFTPTVIATFDDSGSVGIGTASPATKLDVNGLVRVYQTATTTCSTTVEGSIFYNSGNGHFWGCDGTSWNQLDN